LTPTPLYRLPTPTPKEKSSAKEFAEKARGKSKQTIGLIIFISFLTVVKF
jgi:hypothetical protein